MPECYGEPRAFQHIDVRIGWRARRVKHASVIRTLPDAGLIVKRLTPLTGASRDLPSLALQTVRNPLGQSAPPSRPPVIGHDGRKYVWVYSRAGTRCGWILEDDIELDPWALSKPPLLGPARRDFEVGRSLPQLKKPSGCGKRSLTTPLRRVVARDTFLRYSPRGTGFHYLHRDDVVRLLLVNAQREPRRD